LFFFIKIATIITVSRKLVKLGKRICLFVYYVGLINTKLLMAEEGVALKGGLEHWMMEGRIRRGIQKQCE